jgi:hypothetical protein
MKMEQEFCMPTFRYTLFHLHRQVGMKNNLFFWVIARRLNFVCRCFGTLCLFHLHRQVGTYKIQTPGNYPEENIQHSERGESLKSRIKFNENGFSGSQVISCGWTDGQTDFTKLIAAFSNSANAPKICNWMLPDHCCWTENPLATKPWSYGGGNVTSNKNRHARRGKRKMLTPPLLDWKE